MVSVGMRSDLGDKRGKKETEEEFQRSEEIKKNPKIETLAGLAMRCDAMRCDAVWCSDVTSQWDAWWALVDRWTTKRRVGIREMVNRLS